MYVGKFTFPNRLGLPYSWKEIYRFSLFDFVFEGNFQVQAPWGKGTCIWRGDLPKGFCVTILGGLYFEGLILRGAYFWNFHGRSYTSCPGVSSVFGKWKTQLRAI